MKSDIDSEDSKEQDNKTNMFRSNPNAFANKDQVGKSLVSKLSI